jgi:hypothetical protein
MKKTALFLIVMSFCAFSAHAAETAFQGVNEGFESGDAGWQPVISKIKISRETTGGNSGAYMKTDGQMEVGWVNTTPQYTGNFQSRHLESIEVDLIPYECVSPYFRPMVRVRFDASDNGWSYKFNDFLCDNKAWKTYKAPFNAGWTDAEAKANGWAQESNSKKTFAETMQHVKYLILSMGVSWKHTVMGMDNFKLIAKEINTVAPVNPAIKPGELNAKKKAEIPKEKIRIK